MHILFFARIREDIGHSSETTILPENVSSVGQLIDHLRLKGDNYKVAFENESIIRIAVNQEYVGLEHTITDQDEVAFFPPMTGG